VTSSPLDFSTCRQRQRSKEAAFGGPNRLYRLVDASGDAKAVERAKDSLQGGPSQVRAPA
jgi:hypothetical protein